MTTFWSCHCQYLILLFLSFAIAIQKIDCIANADPPAYIPAPSYLWGVINSTLRESRVPKHCARILFTDSPQFLTEPYDTSADVSLNLLNNPGNDDWDRAEAIISNEIQETKEHHLEPCLIVVSIVLEPEAEAWLGWDNEHRKRELRHRMTDLFGYWTPVRSRQLVYARISDKIQTLNPCSKAPRYPIRPISPWEILLYDFFAEARIIQSHGKELKVFKETGRWHWICEDTLIRLQGENYCKETQNNSAVCQKLNFQGSWEWQLEDRIQSSKRNVKPLCKLGYKPRRL